MSSGQFWSEIFYAQGTVITGGTVLIGASESLPPQDALVGIYTGDGTPGNPDLSSPLATTTVRANNYSPKPFRFPQPVSVSQGQLLYLVVRGIGSFTAYDNASNMFIAKIEGFR